MASTSKCLAKSNKSGGVTVAKHAVDFSAANFEAGDGIAHVASSAANPPAAGGTAGGTEMGYQTHRKETGCATRCSTARLVAYAGVVFSANTSGWSALATPEELIRPRAVSGYCGHSDTCPPSLSSMDSAAARETRKNATPLALAPPWRS
jgi:hypothetical protein